MYRVVHELHYYFTRLFSLYLLIMFNKAGASLTPETHLKTLKHTHILFRDQQPSFHPKHIYINK